MPKFYGINYLFTYNSNYIYYILTINRGRKGFDGEAVGVKGMPSSESRKNPAKVTANDEYALAAA
jgi:hypothetical protein